MRDAAPADGAGCFRAGDEILGRYAVEAELGRGGMGVVYLCFDKVGGVKVAVKGLPPEVSHNTEEMEDVRRNFQLVCALRHPGIAGIRTLECEESTGLYYLVMDIAEGRNLTRWMREHDEPGLTPEKLTILRDIASALDYAHARQIIHRDIKPGNVMVGPDGHAQVLDFGLAAQIHSSMSRMSLQVTSQSGTPAYKSPEQWKGRPQRAAADQYALAVIAYRLVSGELPFDGDDLGMLGHAVMNEPPPEIPAVSSVVNSALRKALSKDPQERYPDCSAFVAALSRPPDGKASSSRGFNPWMLLALAVTILVAGIIVACLRNWKGDAPVPPEHVTPANLPVRVETPAPIVPPTCEESRDADRVIQQVDAGEAKMEVRRQVGREAARKEREAAARKAAEAVIEQSTQELLPIISAEDRVKEKEKAENDRIKAARRMMEERLKRASRSSGNFRP